jgi:hypothetical protein
MNFEPMRELFFVVVFFFFFFFFFFLNMSLSSHCCRVCHFCEIRGVKEVENGVGCEACGDVETLGASVNKRVVGHGGDGAVGERGARVCQRR